MTLSPHSVLVIAPDVVSQELEGELVLLSLDRAEYYGLNATGTEVWKFLSIGLRLDETATRLAERCGIQLERAMHDVLALAHMLVEEGLATTACAT